MNIFGEKVILAGSPFETAASAFSSYSSVLLIENYSGNFSIVL